MVLRGRIDRVDTAEGGTKARVIDYKAGKLPDSLDGKGTPLMAGERVQLALYRAALGSIGAYASCSEVEGEFLHLEGGRTVARSFSAAEIREAAGRLPDLVGIVAEGIAGGSFFARTKGLLYGDRQCEYCEFTPICGKDRRRREERKSGDPSVQRFSRLREMDSGGEGRE